MNKNVRLALVILVSIYFLYYISSYTEWHFIDNVNLIFHEASHTIFSSFGMFIKILAGSGLQIAIPLFISLYFFNQNQIVSGSICLMWVGQNLLNISIYIKDAIVMNLPLLGGDYVIHDWNYLLNNIGLLQHSSGIALTVYILGLLTIFTGIFFSISHSSKN